MSKLETNTIDTVSGTSTLQVGSTNTSTITLGVSGDTINVPSGVTIANSGTATGFGEANTPAFKAYYNGSQTIGNNSSTKITVYGTEEYDTDNAFASNRFTVPSGKAGKYIFFATLSDDTGSSSTNTYSITFKKNGSAGIGTTSGYLTAYQQMQMFGIDDLAVGDYVEVYLYQSSGGDLTLDGNERVFFSGFRIIT